MPSTLNKSDEESMKNRAFFSVIIPNHNRPILLQRALESIKSQQCELPCEIIVVSDVANSDVYKVCDQLLGENDVYIRRNGIPRLPINRNLGLTLASGRYILFLDDDDAWHPDLLSQLAQSTEIKEGKFVWFNCSVVQESRFESVPKFIDETPLDLSHSFTEQIYLKNQVHMSCVAFPRDLIGNTRFDPYLKAYEDWDFLLSIIGKEAPTHLPVTGSRVFEVKDESSDRMGNGSYIHSFNSVMDYLYIYRRHPAPNDALRQQRVALLKSVGLEVPADML
jgi:glycosyltransferase involved in cell wall biosynthesis